MKIILLIIIIIATSIVSGLFLFIKSSMKPLSHDTAIENINKLLKTEVERKRNLSSAVVLVDSAAYKVSETFTAGIAAKIPSGDQQPFHTASVGKVFTATLIAILKENGALKFDDKINNYLNENLLKNLFIFDSIDYSSEVTIEQLLNHKSGAVDYFEDPVHKGKTMKELILEQPEKLWSPGKLLAFSQENQKPVGIPDGQFHYSDTGYILLGYIIESITKMTFDKYLHQQIFTPLKMNDSYLMFYSKPVNKKRPIAEIWFNGVEISGYNSLSIDWAGGGIVSTAADLAIFIRALNNYELISKETLNSMYNFKKKYMRGIHYGLGFMEFNFGEYFPTLKSLPKMRGHMGVLGTQMLYDKGTDTVYISNFGSTDYAAGSVRAMIRILGYLSRIDQRFPSHSE